MKMKSISTINNVAKTKHKKVQKYKYFAASLDMCSNKEKYRDFFLCKKTLFKMSKLNFFPVCRFNFVVNEMLSALRDRTMCY